MEVELTVQGTHCAWCAALIEDTRHEDGAVHGTTAVTPPGHSVS